MSLICTSPNHCAMLKEEFSFLKDRDSTWKRLKFFESDIERSRFCISNSAYYPVDLPCGLCKACRLLYSKDWAIRCQHEASLYEKNSFITLTYDDNRLPTTQLYNDDGEDSRFVPTLFKRDFQLFMKRLRRMFPDRMIRYFYCGEYGEQTSRPHYHCILFNFAFEDILPDPFRPVNEFGQPLYASPLLDYLWQQGHCVIGEVTFETCSYVARYIMKKQKGDNAKGHYAGRLPEYVNMSTDPGIGAFWFDRFGLSDVIYTNSVLYEKKGSKHRSRVPKYYDKLIEIKYGPDVLKACKDARRKFALLSDEEQELCVTNFNREHCERLEKVLDERTKKILMDKKLKESF